MIYHVFVDMDMKWHGESVMGTNDFKTSMGILEENLYNYGIPDGGRNCQVYESPASEKKFVKVVFRYDPHTGE